MDSLYVTLNWFFSITPAIMLRSRLASVPKAIKRNISTNVPALQKATDPIQQLFLDKLREYKSKGGNGKLVDPSPEIIKERQSELEKLSAQYGGGEGVDMTKFPQFQFVDPPVDTGKK
ncbi:PREDICTED: ATP synthase-coupling factor 6, mitochondrial isoform X1 [Wasmannia auropunctata]|uniref:ATP synthase-coupling factor 6, mitochondrial isoform X1 n=2 Tax=Wasmannia auropunctata TaxID=64793 RepID=UPI0005EE05D1|nr:PREDICTED: ATP synthase-coupling factor 6, mitochondrial isoform X1 [Wasmannia auropunctata]